MKAEIIHDIIKWVQQPNRIVFAVGVACAIGLFGDYKGWFELTNLGAEARPALFLGLILCACLVVISIVCQLYHKSADTVGGWRTAKRLGAQEKADKEQQQEALAQLDDLSDDEINVIAAAVRDNLYLFRRRVHDATCFSLCEKGLLVHDTGAHFRAHGYQFQFPDFVWAEITRRGQEFKDKDTFVGAFVGGRIRKRLE